MRVLLSDGTGLTSRQVATLLHRAGHEVEVLAPTRLGPAGFTRHVRRLHRVPAFGLEPEAWLEAALAVLRAGHHDVLLPTQEQVTILARDADRVRALGAALAVPSFAALLRVQDKVAQARTLAELGLPHPPTRIVADATALRSEDRFPIFVKTAIGTAGSGVIRVGDRAALEAAATALEAEGAFADGVVVQEALDGSLAMVQAVYAEGELVACHANLREREGANGGATVKRSMSTAEAEADLRTLGTALRWHGALSLDAIVTPGGLRWIDVNPRLVEPGNAAASGTDLAGALLAVSIGAAVPSRPPSRAGVRTHQLLLGVLGAAQRPGTRRAVARELADGLRRRGPYSDSHEELTPMQGDPRSAIPVLAAAALTLARPATWNMLAGGAVSAYALTPAAWRTIAKGA